MTRQQHVSVECYSRVERATASGGFFFSEFLWFLFGANDRPTPPDSPEFICKTELLTI